MERIRPGFWSAVYGGCIPTTALAVIVALCLPGAQAANEDALLPSASLMEEVLVFGTKRSTAQIAQTTPGQLAAFDERQLELRNVLTLEDLSFATPNVQLDPVGTQVSYASFSIRGLGIDNSTPSIDPNVGVFINDVYAGMPFGIVADTFDLDRIEIFKGPQSLLYGRNVTGGAVLLRTRRPQIGSGLGIKARFSVENYQRVGSLALESDLIEGRLAGRLSMQMRIDDGWFSNTVRGRSGAQESDLIRGTLVFQATEDLVFTVIAEHGNVDGDGSPVQDLFTRPGSPLDPRTATYTSRFPLRPQNSEFNINHNFVGDGKVDWTQINLETEWSYGVLHVKNVAAYREVDALSSADVDGLPRASLIGSYAIDQHQFSEELRLNAELGSRWSSTLGFSYFDQRYDYNTALVLGARDTDATGDDRIGGGTQDHYSYAVFWSNEIRLTDSFFLIGGLNYLKEKKDVSIVAREHSSVAAGLCDVANLECDFALGGKADDSWGNVSYKTGFQWWLADEIQTYAHWTTAFRSGFFNLRPCCESLAQNPVPTDVEKHSAFELGLKSLLADGRIRFNAAMFVQEIDDLARSSGYLLPDGAPAQDLVNVGDARIWGAEADLMVRVLDNLVVTGAFGYLNGDITDAKTDINRDGILGDAADEALGLTRLSPYSANAGVNYLLRLPTRALIFDANYSYRDEAAARDDNAAFFPSVSIVNASVSLLPDASHWSFKLYAKNLTNRVVYNMLFPLSAGRVFAPVQEGRAVGFELRYEL